MNGKNNWFIRLVVWLGIMAALALLMMGIWVVGSGNSYSTASLKWLQFLQTIGIFLLPPIVCAWIWDEQHKPMAWLKLDRGADKWLFVLAIAIMICAIPAINLLADLNSRIQLPECMASIEQWMRAREDDAAQLTERFLQADHFGMMIVNLGLMALLPAIAEELSFRGTLQQILANGEGMKANSEGLKAKVHVAIWATAILFSAIHMQFYGFIPRMLMGATFGYLFAWTGSLWIPIMMHFTNNGIAVIVYYLFGEIGENSKNYADTIGAGTTWYIGVISLVITSLGLLIFYRRTHTR